MTGVASRYGLTAGVAVVGFLSGPIDVGVPTLRQRRTAQGEPGRVRTVSMGLNLARLPLGSVLGSILLTCSGHAALLAAALSALTGRDQPWRHFMRGFFLLMT